MFITNDHIYYKRPCLLQTTMFITNDHIYYKRPCLLQTTMFITNDHIYYKRPYLLQTTIFITNDHIYYKRPCLLQTTMFITNDHVYYKRSCLLIDQLFEWVSDCCFQLYHDSTSSYKYFAHIQDETTLIFINDRNEWITRTTVYNNTFYSIIRKTLVWPKNIFNIFFIL